MSRILTLLDNAVNARVLEQMLGGRHEAPRTPVDDADIAIVDYASVPAHAEFLRARKQSEEPVFFSVLLVAARQNAAVFKWAARFACRRNRADAGGKGGTLRTHRNVASGSLPVFGASVAKRRPGGFIHAMTHDPRAPLRTVSGFAEAMAEDQAGRLDAAGQRHLERIQAAVRQMWELIESLVAFSRIGDAEADPSLLKIAICNLISNGIKYVEKGVAPHVEISAVRAVGKVKLEFRDNGIGLRDEDQQKIFTPFVRLHGEEDYPGFGLGLSAARKVIEIIGGETGVASSPGKGSTFWFELAAGGEQ